VGCDVSTDFYVVPLGLTIAYVDPHIAGKRVGENNTQLCSWYWPGDDESIVPILTSIVDTTHLSMMNAAITGLPGPSWEFRELCGCREKPNGDGGPYACDVTLIVDNNTAA